MTAAGDQRVGHLDGVQHAVAGVAYVEDRTAGPDLGGDDVPGGRLDGVGRHPRVDEQVEVGGLKVALLQDPAGGVRRQVGRLLVGRGDVPAPDAAVVVDQPPGQVQCRIAVGEPVFQLGRAQCGLGQVGGHPGQPGVQGQRRPLFCAGRLCRSRVPCLDGRRRMEDRARARGRRRGHGPAVTGSGRAGSGRRGLPVVAQPETDE
ncbi:hypothetical protein GCM10027612_01150 [Microbispora bryophytorum subsp. camponoti]